MKYHLLLWVCLINLPLTAQTFQGQVVDRTNGKALETVIVCLLRADSTHLEFGYTDAEGRFSIQTPTEKEPPVYLSFHLLGYAPQTVSIAKGQTSFQIAMSPKEFKLKEVKITPDRIVRKGDTLTYKVSGFKMPQDKQIADVLKRLPGIEVTTDGAISYEGKRINAFYIDNMDLLGGQYTIASNNLAAKKVKEVQVLTNHQKVKALKGLKFTDQAALNLVLEDEAKSHFMTAIDTEEGYGDGEKSKLLWNNRILGMLFGHTQQKLFLYKNTNMGQQIELELSDQIEQSRTAGSKEKGILSIGRKTTDLQEHRTLFNNAHVLTANQLWKPNKDIDLRFQLHYLHDEPQQSSNTAITYFLPEENQTITEKELLNKKQDKICAELTYLKNAPHVYIKNNVRTNLTFTEGRQALATNLSPLTQATNLREKHLHHTLEWIARHRRNAFSLYCENHYDKFPQQMRVSPGLYPDILNNHELYEGWKQSVNLQSFRSHTYTYFQHPLWRMLIRYQAGIEWHGQWMDSALDIRQGNGQTTSRTDFANHLRLSNSNIYAEPSLSLIQELWKIELLCRITYKHLQLQTSRPASGKEKESYLMPEPQLRISWEPNGFWRFNIHSAYGSRFNDIRELYEGYIFTSYRSASLFQPQINKQRTGRVKGNVSYSNPITGWFSTWSGEYSFTLRNLLYERTLNSILEERKAICRPNRSTQWNIGVKNTKTFAFWKSSVTLAALYTSSVSEQKIQGEMMSVRSGFGDIRLGCYAQPIRSLTFEWNSDYQHIYQHSSLPSASTNQWHHKLQCSLFPSEKWQITWLHELYHNNHPENRSAFFSDLIIEHTFPLFDIALIVRNLFNRNTCECIYMSNLSEYVYRQALRPREITLRLSFAL